MKRPLNVLPHIHIASPCPVSWDQMAGDDSVRHCSNCGQAVYNLSSLTTEQAAELLSGAIAPCVRLYRRTDGTVLTRDCTERRLDRVRRATRRAAVALASWFGIVLAAGCQKESDCTRTMGKPMPPPSSQPSPDAAVEPGR